MPPLPYVVFLFQVSICIGVIVNDCGESMSWARPEAPIWTQ